MNLAVAPDPFSSNGATAPGRRGTGAPGDPEKPRTRFRRLGLPPRVRNERRSERGGTRFLNEGA